MITFLCLIFLLLIGCGETKNYSEKNNDISIDEKENIIESNESSTTEGQENKQTSNEETKENSAIKKAAIKEQVIYDQNKVKISVKGLEYDEFFGTDLKLHIENNSDQSITVQTDHASINNIMVETIFSAEVAPGKKANDGITFMDSDLEAYDIQTIGTIEFELVIFDSESWEDISRDHMVRLETDLFGSFEQSYYPEGAIAIDRDGIKLVIKSVNYDDWLGPEVLVYMENNSNRSVTIQARELSVNGYMVDHLFSADVPMGKVRYDTLSFISSDLEENEITIIENIELYFSVFDMVSWDGIFETDPVKINFD